LNSIKIKAKKGELSALDTIFAFSTGEELSSCREIRGLWGRCGSSIAYAKRDGNSNIVVVVGSVSSFNNMHPFEYEPLEYESQLVCTHYLED
jgi:hypothetical protein